MSIFLFLLLIVSPLSAQEGEPEEAAETTEITEMPAAMAKGLLVIDASNRKKSFDTNTGAVFLGKSFIDKSMPDGSIRTFAYKSGYMDGKFYVLPLEVRSEGRLRSLHKFYFAYKESSGETHLVRWEEVNYVSRNLLRNNSFGDLNRGVGFFQSIQPKPKEETAPPEDI